MLVDDIFNEPFDFNAKAVSVFLHQATTPGIYSDYILKLKVNPKIISRAEEIPFLPISFFKTHTLREEGANTEIIFSSSGTSGAATSNHFVTDLDIYIKSFTTSFRLFYGDIKKYCFLALLPSYLERNGSSLVFMCDHLIKQSQHPLSGFYLDQMAELRDSVVRGETDLIESAVEEVLRWGTVTMHFRRTATSDVEMHDRLIRRGDKVVIWFNSADFDARQFPDPYTFDIHRSPNEHVAFGRMSPHLCLGAQLARMELNVVFEELLPRISDARFNGPVERLRSNFISGIKRLPISVTAA